MKNHEQLTVKEMITQVQELGLINSGKTLKCRNCESVFPYEYKDCPRCQIDKSTPEN